ncbi:TonB-linked outer membrane protein, SusC/RagA family [Dyadobacter soli]|uniref:TonB-linked outer membrane protein, SusC/RagA family n=1 Tax=Dyadobacter soli TaxID=659014 RepID=A0A1G7VJ25_9BACT|nr:TonB-dependent receptor [Dyadobacter soli]SDG59568.1 TonB-linked outer membrane protein, SusC/RagA family [Dyadobacter soli]
MKCKTTLLKTRAWLAGLLMMLWISASAQRIISGTVHDKSGPVAGASIVIKGSLTGTTSATDGSFTINAANGDILTVSYIGFETVELKVHAQQKYEIVLKEADNLLSDVVVTGYATQKKENLTGAVAAISGKDLQNRPITNIAQALQGQMANLNVTTGSSGGAPDARPNINIRGYTGLGNKSGGGISGAPLIVLDGIPGGDLTTINPSDIESISILKDAAASAIYGSSAPYGVMLVTTKQGKKGARPSITYSNNLSWSQPIGLPKMINSVDFANIFNEAFINSGRTAWYDDETLQRIRDYKEGRMKDETINDPTPGVDDWYGSGNGYSHGAGPNRGNGNNDWFKIFFKDWSASQQHNLGVSGGGESSRYYLGLGYLEKNGMYNFTDEKYKRITIRTNVSSDLAKWLTLNIRSSLSRGLNSTPATYPDATGGNLMHQIGRKLPTTPFRNPDGHYSDYSNIGLFTEGGKQKYTTDQVQVTAETVVKPLPGWNITANYTLFGTSKNTENFNKTVYSYLPSGNKVVMFQTAPINSLTKSNEVQDKHVINLFSTYEKSVGGHNFQVLGGYIRDLTNFKYQYATNSYLYSNDLPALNLTYNSTPSIGDNMRVLAVEGVFGRLNYNFKEKYLVEVNGRYDASSRFLKSARWKLYPAVSVGYSISKEDFWKPLSHYVNTLKIRGSYGALGDQWGDNPNQDNYYPFYPSLGTNAPNSSTWIFGNGRQAYVTSPALINSSLTWASIKTFDLGIDATFFKDRLAASFDWYNRRADDFVGPAQALPAVLGAAVPQANNASMQTKGFELTVDWRDKAGEVNYFVKGVLSNSNARVIRYPNPTKLLSNWYEGQQIGEIWGYETAGLFQTKEQVNAAPSQNAIDAVGWTPGDVQYKDLNGDGVITPGSSTVGDPGDRKVIGNSTPRFLYGLSIGADWKGFDFSLFVQGVARRDSWISSNYFWGIIGGEWQSTLLTPNLDRYTPETPNGYFPKYYMTSQMNKNMQVQTRYLQNSAYMRVKNLQIGYSIPNSSAKKLGLQRVRLYVSMDNLATFTRLQKTIDPELSIGDSKIYPLQRTYSFGINLTL